MRNAKCFCGSGLKKKKCHSEVHEKSTFSEIIRLHKEVDERIEHCTDKAQVKCKKGCADCCKQAFIISPNEYYYIADYYINTYGIESFQKLLSENYLNWLQFEKDNPKIAENLKRNVEGNNILNLVDNLMEYLYETKETNKIYCPFLDKESMSCSVYDARPTVCRMHGTTKTSEYARMDIKQAICDNYDDTVDLNGLPMIDDLLLKEKDLSMISSQKFKVKTIERCFPIFYFLKTQYDVGVLPLKHQIFENKEMDREKSINNKIVRLISRS